MFLFFFAYCHRMNCYRCCCLRAFVPSFIYLVGCWMLFSSIVVYISSCLSHKTFCARKTLRPTRRDLVIVRVVIVCCSHKIIINNYYGGGNLRACTMHIDVKMHTLYGTWCVRVNNGYDEVNHGWRDDDDLPTQYAAQYIALVVFVVVSLIEHFIFWILRL